jgi:hypothetical protein
MPDRVSVTTRQGWGSRLSESIKSVLFGVVLFLVAFPVLFWNEGRAVRTARSLTEGAGLVVSVGPDGVNAANEGQLVHVSGFAKTDDVLEDETFGVSDNAIQLIRDVEMYQWVEQSTTQSENELGGSEERTTTYDYEKSWRSSLVDSSGFHSPGGHENPRAFPYDSRTARASDVRLGAFRLSDSQTSMLRKTEPLPVTSLPSGLGPNAQTHDGEVYLGRDPANPEIGDVRVRFRVVRPGPVSVVARQVGSSFEPYRAEAGGTVFLLEESITSADAMFESAQRSNTAVTWVVRALGFFMMFLGLGLAFKPIAVFGDVVPLVGNLLGAGVGLFSGLVAAFFSFATIAIAWIVYRPLVGIALLALALGAIVLLARTNRGKSRATPPPVPPPPPVPAG